MTLLGGKLSFNFVQNVIIYGAIDAPRYLKGKHPSLKPRKAYFKSSVSRSRFGEVNFRHGHTDTIVGERFMSMENGLNGQTILPVSPKT